MALAVPVTFLLVPSAVRADSPDPVPAANDVTAGWLAALVFVFLIAAVVFLARSLVKQLRKAQAAQDAGVYGEEPAEPADGTTDGSTGGTTGDTPGGSPTQPPRGAAPR
jgi:hypothetical protein